LPNLIDLTGKKFSRWTVVKKTGCSRANGANWLCVCDCGTQKIVNSRALRYGQSRSCGCYRSELQSKRMVDMHTTHNDSNSREHRIWLALRARCTNPNNPAFKNYGGRGITVCTQWAKNYQCFLDDMGRAPEGMWLDRIDNNKGYSPENCRWATVREQQNNRRSNRNITVAGKTRTLQQWGRISPVDRKTIAQRISNGWDEKDAVFTAKNQPRGTYI